MRKFPTVVKIGGHEYRIIRKTKAEMKRDHEGALGICDFDGLCIYICKGMRKTKAQEVLLHEIAHACTYPSLVAKRHSDEEFVDGVADKLAAMLRDNPDVVAYLTEINV
jgi:hypothetical protein